jgi:hypothetical protein
LNPSHIEIPASFNAENDFTSSGDIVRLEMSLSFILNSSHDISHNAKQHIRTGPIPIKKLPIC